MLYLVLATVLTSGCARAAQTPPAPSTVDLVVAATTDVHGRLRGWDYYADAPDSARGLARAATIVDSVRASNPGRVILLDAGDLLQGNPLTYVAARVHPEMPHPVIAAMNAMQYDAAAIGNHEFNYGLPTLDRAISEARFPMLATNAYRPNGERAFRGWTIVERDGVKVGIVGATTPGSMLWDRDNLSGKLTIRDIVPEVRTAVDAVKRAGADVVLVTIHSGLNEPSSYDTVTTGVASENVAARVAHEVPGIDLLLYGHSHREMADTVIGSTLLIQPKNWATSVAVAHLGLARVNGRWTVASRTGTLVRAMRHAESPAVLAVTDAAHRATVAYATTPIGNTPVAWRADSARVVDTPLIDFILAVERQATGAQLASTAAFSLDASLAAGPVNVARIAALYPYDNTLRAIRITGRQLRDYLEWSARYYRRYDGDTAPVVNDSVPGFNYDIVSGVDYVLDLSKPVGGRVTKLEYAGRAVTPTDTFTLALNNYRQTGGGGASMFAGAPLIDDRQLEIRQLLIDEVRKRGTLRPEDYFMRNWELTPQAAVARAYAEMNRGTADGGPPSRASNSTTRPTTTAARPSGPRVRVIATNDFHGALEARADNNGVRRGGAAFVAAAIEQARAACAPPECESILLDGGDLFQGTPASNFAYGRSVLEVFNALGYAGTALGNHDFDWGRDTLRALMRAARFPILGANVRYANGRDVEWIPNDTIVQRGAYRVGIIGISDIATPRTTKASNVTGLRFDDPVPIIDSIAPALRARGADVVIVLAHEGAFCNRDGSCTGEIIDVARRLTTKVDAIVSGHTHSVVSTKVNGIPVMQAASRGQSIETVDIPVRAGAVGGQEVRSIVTDSLTPDPRIAAIVDRAVARVAPRVNQKVADIGEDMPRAGSQYPLGNLIADAMRAAGKAEIGIMNSGGIRAPLRSGTATYGSVFEVMPFANVLYLVRPTGAVIRRYLEQELRRGTPNAHVSGMTVTYDSTRAAGSRVLAVQVGNTPLDDARRYSVVINDFMLSDTLTFGAPTVPAQPLNIVDLDAVIAYLRSRPQPVMAPKEQRFIPGSVR